MSDDELPPSKLGTKDHWDEVYGREVRVFQDVGDEGEVWFGESSINKMRQWASTHLPPSPTPTPTEKDPLRILECGSGNGTLLLSFLTSKPSTTSTSSRPPTPQKYHLTGIDYSPLAASLASSIESTRRSTLPDELDDEDEGEVMNDCTIEWRTADLLRHDFRGEVWDLVMDKGTFDALALSDERVKEEGNRLPSKVYPEKVSKLVKNGGWFLITSCNFTEEEIKKRYTKEGLGLVYHSSVPHKSFAFGGKTGTTVCTVAFQKVGQKLELESQAPSSTNSIVPHNSSISTAALSSDTTSINHLTHPKGVALSSSSSLGSKSDTLYMCIDCGGTKTEIAIASGEREIVSRAVGGTSNMAEVGLETSYSIITATVMKAISNLPEKYRTIIPSSKEYEKDKSPIHFEDVWVGISGCDTDLDERLMSKMLGRFFSKPSLPILNDAHLLGGVLLTNGCPWGIAVIAGTGSVVLQLEVLDGKVVQTGRRGGLGFLLGDDGSAFDLGRWALRYAVDDYDSGLEVEGGLAAKIRAHFGVEKTGEVLAKVYALDTTLPAGEAANLRKLRISSLAPSIIASYDSTPRDPLAVRALESSVSLLAESIESLVNRSMTSTLGPKKRVEDAALIVGGGLGRQEGYRDVLRRILGQRGIVFGKEEWVGDVAGDGCLGLVDRALGKRV